MDRVKVNKINNQPTVLWLLSDLMITWYDTFYMLLGSPQSVPPNHAFLSCSQPTHIKQHVALQGVDIGLVCHWVGLCIYSAYFLPFLRFASRTNSEIVLSVWNLLRG